MSTGRMPTALAALDVPLELVADEHALPAVDTELTGRMNENLAGRSKRSRFEAPSHEAA